MTLHKKYSGSVLQVRKTKQQQVINHSWVRPGLNDQGCNKYHQLIQMNKEHRWF